MNQRIIYPNDNGGVVILMPAPECGLTIEEIAAKDVPAGKEYKIVNDSDIPTDRTFRDAWELVDGQIVVNEAKKQAIIDAQTAVTTVKESALAKLAALGLTQDEVKALIG
jgi:hypothetical protein